MVLRIYQPEDCKEMAELFYHTVHLINAKDYTKEQLDVWAAGQVDLEKWNQSFQNHDTIVAVEDNKIVGFGDMDQTGYLDRLYVHAEYQGRGIATAVCNHLERNQTDKFVTHASITARPFFEKRGYRVVKEQQVERQGILLTNFIMEKENMQDREHYQIVTLADRPEMKEQAAQWFHEKWEVPMEAYLESMEESMNGKRYLALEKEQIIGGLGVIENDFHDRKDLTPNVCAVYVEEERRCRGIAKALLHRVCADMKDRGIDTLYLITDHTSFYERYGWEFLCMVQGDGEPELTRMYIHRT